MRLAALPPKATSRRPSQTELDNSMPADSRIELRDLVLPCSIGTYGPGDSVPTAHALDLDLTLDARLVLIDADSMARVFDYDPLIAAILALSARQHFETQEYLISQIAALCARHGDITAAVITLRKHPVTAASGSLGVRLRLDAQALAALR
jgi:dihydroneopterin aldolase